MQLEEKIARLRLIRTPRVGPSTYNHLIETSGGAQAALERVLADDLANGVRLQPPSEAKIRGELAALKRLGAQIIMREDASFPALLREIPLGPVALSVLGQTAALQANLLAIVGARNASHSGLRMAEKLAHDLADAGYRIVSGMARGVDSAAHRASLASGTIAVLAGGVDQIYPRENTELYQKITEKGAILSEMPLGHEPQARLFPRRNRIIAGMCRLLIVIESSLKSGSRITANFAADYGREVGAVPGSPLDSRNLGCLGLIRDGAHVITRASDVIDILDSLDGRQIRKPPQSYTPPPMQEPVETTQVKSMIIEYVGFSICPIADLMHDIPATEPVLRTALAELELEGRILRKWDNRIHLIESNTLGME